VPIHLVRRSHKSDESPNTYCLPSRLASYSGIALPKDSLVLCSLLLLLRHSKVLVRSHELLFGFDRNLTSNKLGGNVSGFRYWGLTFREAAADTHVRSRAASSEEDLCFGHA
jgi:hypothetical protein